MSAAQRIGATLPAIAGWLLLVPCLADDRPAARRYDAGPLTAADFQAPIPNPLPDLGRFKQFGLADTDIHFEMKYHYRETADGVEAKLTDIDLYAIFITGKSWLARKNDPAALDHEQGHFDITQMYALQTKHHLLQQLEEGKTLVGQGESVNEAVKDLDAQVHKLLKPTYDRAAVAQQQYDRDTQHGVHASNQAAVRKRQIELLQELNEKLASRVAQE